MYDETQSNTTLKEKFNISSYPAPVKFENNSSNNNDSLDIKTDLGENKVDYPTIKYISNKNTNFDEQYFSMISGNDISNISSKIVSTNDMSDYTRGGNHPTNESFDDVADAQKTVGDFIADLSNIFSVLITPSTTENEQYVISSAVFTLIIEYLNQMNTIIKAGAKNFDTITSTFKSAINKSSTNVQLSNYVDKLVIDSNNLIKYNTVTFDYSTLVTNVNANPIIKTSNVTPINANIFNPTNSLIDNLIIFLQQSLVLALQGKINENMPKGAKLIATATTAANCSNIHDEKRDPTVGTCSIKMLPLQKWVNVIVSVYNQVVDIYVDGLLTSSCVLQRFPAISTSDVTLTPDGGFSGYVSRVKFLNSAMTVQKAKDIYNDGPIYSESLFSQIPNWVYWTFLAIIIAAIGYSFYV
jgi:hypothetical protein